MMEEPDPVADSRELASTYCSRATSCAKNGG